MPLKREPNLKDPDGLYAAILDAHADLSESESVALNARLVLLLANHIGEEAIVREALALARQSIDEAARSWPESCPARGPNPGRETRIGRRDGGDPATALVSSSGT